MNTFTNPTKELQVEFDGIGEVRGDRFKQVMKSDKAYMYRRTNIDNGEIVGYEVFKRKINAQYNNVSYPSSKAFGVWAWMFDNRRHSDALNKFNELSEIFSQYGIDN